MFTETNYIANVATMKKGVMVLGCVILGLLLGSLVYAGDITDADYESAFLAQELLLLEDLERREIEAHRSAFESIEKQTKRLVVESPTYPEREGVLPSFDISSINFEGDTLLSWLELRRLKKGYLHKSLTINDINALVKSVTDLYIKKGYVLTRVYLVPQSLKEGALGLKVVEGRLEKIVFEGPFFQRFLAFPFMTGDVFNLKDVEQGLEQINRLSGNNSVLKIVPSTANVGSGVLQITNTTSSPGMASVRYDTYSDMNLRLIPNSLDIQRSNLLNMNDSWTLSYYQKFEDGEKFNNSLSLSTSVPFGYYTGELSYSSFDYATLVVGENTNFITSGKTESASGSLERVMMRSKRGKTSLKVALSSKDTSSFVEDVKSDVGSRKLVLGEVTYGQTLSTGLGQFRGTIVYSRGIARAGATITQSTDSANAQFKRVVGQAYWSQSTRHVYGVITTKSSFKVQAANSILYSSERMSLGGFSSVRGFNTTVQGDEGVLWRSEFSFTNFLFFPRRTSLLMAADIGAVREYGETERTAMYGMAVGLNFNKGRLSGAILHGRPMKASSSVDYGPHTTTFSITVGLL